MDVKEYYVGSRRDDTSIESTTPIMMSSPYNSFQSIVPLGLAAVFHGCSRRAFRA
jgi:hypothetical protein